MRREMSVSEKIGLDPVLAIGCRLSSMKKDLFEPLDTK